MTPGESLRISLLDMALCSYGGCVKNHERVNAFNLVSLVTSPPVLPLSAVRGKFFR